MIYVRVRVRVKNNRRIVTTPNDSYVYPFHLMIVEEDWRPCPIECKLRCVERQWKFRSSTESTAFVIHNIRRISHAAVERRPDRTEDGTWWLPGRCFETFVPWLDVAFGDETASPAANVGQNYCTCGDCSFRLEELGDRR